MANDSLQLSEECRYVAQFWNKEHLPEEMYISGLAACIVNSIAVVPTVLFNGLVIFAMATKNSLHTNTNILLACLAGTDVLAGLITQPFNVVVHIKRILGAGPFCPLEKAHAVAVFGLTAASLSHLALISIDRFIAIKKPLRYEDIVTKERIASTVIVAWTFTLLVTIQETVLAFLNSTTNIYTVYLTISAAILVVVGLFIVAVIIICYAYIYSETRRQKKRLQTEQLPQEEVNKIKKDNKAATTLTLILGTLVITYLPFSAATIVVVNVRSNDLVLSVLWSWISTFISLGSLCNPIIYCWRVKKLRRTFLEIIYLVQPQNGAPAIEMQVIQRRGPLSTTSEAMAAVNQEPGLLSFHNLRAV